MDSDIDKELSWLFSIILIIGLIIGAEYISYDSCQSKATIMGVDYSWGPIDGCEIKKK